MLSNAERSKIRALDIQALLGNPKCNRQAVAIIMGIQQSQEILLATWTSFVQDFPSLLTTKNATKFQKCAMSKSKCVKKVADISFQQHNVRLKWIAEHNGVSKNYEARTTARRKAYGIDAKPGTNTSEFK